MFFLPCVKQVAQRFGVPELLPAPVPPVPPVPPLPPDEPVVPVVPAEPVDPAVPAFPAASGTPMLPVVAPLDIPVLGVVDDDDVPLPVLPEPDAPDWSVPLCLLQPASARPRVVTAIATRLMC